jgi:ABC-type sugar transport system permease subunit
MGYAATISWVLFVLVFAVTAFQLWLQRRESFDV